MNAHCPDDAKASATLLRRMAKVLFGCVVSVERIEALIVSLAQPGIGTDERFSLQEIDLLRQTLSEIAGSLDRISDCQHQNETVDPARILSAMKLDDLKGQLMGRIPISRNPQEDCILF